MVGRAARSSTSGLGFFEEFAKSPTSRTERQKWGTGYRDKKMLRRQLLGG